MSVRRLLAATAAGVVLVVPVAPTAVAAVEPAAPVASQLVPSPSADPYADDPNDPVRKAQFWLSSLGVREAWKTTRGAGQRIAIIDTGVADGPVELAGAVAGGMDASGLGSPGGRTPVGTGDDRAHGTLVGSLAAARGTGPGTGMLGVAPEASLLSVSLGFGDKAPISFDQQVADGIRWAVDQGATVINLSFTTNTLTWPESWDSAFAYAQQRDVVVVVAAGNRGSGTSRVGAPATVPGVLTVAGVDPSGAASVEASTQGIVIGVAAPSEQLLGVAPDGTMVQWNGTSGASPIVAGIAALVRAAHPELNAANVIQRIIATATPAPGMDSVPDALYGYGIVNAQRAVADQVPLVAANPMGDILEWIRVYRRADAKPSAAPQATPEAAAPLPPPGAPTAPRSPLVPSADSLRYASLPLIAASAAGILVALGVTAAVRRSSKKARDSHTEPLNH